MDQESKLGLTEEYTMVVGKIKSNMDMDTSHKKMELKEMANGTEATL